MGSSDLRLSLIDPKSHHKEIFPRVTPAHQQNEDRQAQPFHSYSYYVNACFNPPPFPQSTDTIPTFKMPTSPVRQLPVPNLREALTEMRLCGEWNVMETPHGLIMSFEKKEDADLVFDEMEIAKVLGGPVQVATLPTFPLGNGSKMDNRKNSGLGSGYTIGRYNINVNQMSPHTSPRNYMHQSSQSRMQPPGPLLIRDVPWSITNEELRAALYNHGYQVTSIERWRQHVRIEVKNMYHYEQLVADGVNFYNCGWFAVSGERPGNSGSGHGDTGSGDDVLQCYRCQGFWHVAANCRHLPRCVRCGEPHGVEYCTRVRNNPFCCNCSGAHHAAYKNCPVRKRMSSAAPVAFVLSQDRPIGSFAEVTASVSSTKPRCIL